MPKDLKRHWALEQADRRREELKDLQDTDPPVYAPWADQSDGLPETLTAEERVLRAKATKALAERDRARRK